MNRVHYFEAKNAKTNGPKVTNHYIEILCTTR